MSAGELPAWVQKRGGRLEPFDTDKISRSLFAATESCGRPDAFLARELTDGALHFLARDLEGSTPNTGQISEMVAKVVRELGQPVVAMAFMEFARSRSRTARKALQSAAQTSSDEGGDRSAARIGIAAERHPIDLVRRMGETALREFSLGEVFSRDIVAAQRDGFVSLDGLEAPFQLQGAVLPRQSRDKGTLESLEAINQVTGRWLAIDAPELEVGDGNSDRIQEYTRELLWGLRACGLKAILNLNSESLPLWAGEIAGGPLFPAGTQPTNRTNRKATAISLLERLVNAGKGRELVRVDWHCGEGDLESADFAKNLPKVPVDAVCYVFDRRQQAVALAEGLDRQHQGYLLAVGIHLPRLAEQPSVRRDPTLFLKKLESLARLAISAGIQKREFLRRSGANALSSGYVLERAQLVVVPIGLQAIVRILSGRELGDRGKGGELGREILGRLHEVLQRDGGRQRLEARLDSSPQLDLPTVQADRQTRSDDRGLAGLTTWRPGVSPADQIIGGGELHEANGGGTAFVVLTENEAPSGDEIAAWLQLVWRETSLVRIRFLRGGRTPTQLMAPWEREGGTDFVARMVDERLP
jgi:hypothetical protein